MSDDLGEMQSLTHAYRKSLDAFEARSGHETQTIDQRGSGEEREKIARMDADLSAIEMRAQLKATQARLEKLEKEPVLSSRSGPITNSDDYSARWLKAMVRGDQAEIRAMGVGTANASIPTDMERLIRTKMYQSTVIRQLASVQTIDSNRQITVEASTPTANLVAEAGAITAADFTFDRVTVTPYKFVAATKMSQEYIDDAIGSGGIGSILNWVAERFAVALGRETEEYYTVGTGSSQPQGIGDTSSTSFATTNAGRIINQGVTLAEDAAYTAITADNIIDCIHAVPPAYRVGKFAVLTHDLVLKAIRKLKANNEYIWLPGGAGNNQGITVGAPSTVYGVPVYVNEWVPTAVGSATDANTRGNAHFIVGNWDHFGIFDRTGMQSMVDPYSASANLQTTMYMWMRTDSKILLPEAFAAISSLNAAA